MNYQINKLLADGRNDRLDVEDDIEHEISTEEELDDGYEPLDDQNDIFENPGDYDEDGERGYWAD